MHPPIYHDVPDIPHHPAPLPHLPVVKAPVVHPKAFAKDGPTGAPLAFGAPLSISVALNKYGSPVYVSTPAPYLLTQRTTPKSTTAPTTPPAPEIETIRPPTEVPPTFPPPTTAVPDYDNEDLGGRTDEAVRTRPLFPVNLAQDPVSHAVPIGAGFPGVTPRPGILPPHPTPSLSFAPNFLNSPAGPTIPPVTDQPIPENFPGTVPAVPGLVFESVTPGPPVVPVVDPHAGHTPFRPAFLNSQNSLGPEAIAPGAPLPPVVAPVTATPATPTPGAPSEIPEELPRTSGGAPSIFGGSLFGNPTPAPAPVPASTAAPSLVPESPQPFQFSTLPTAQAAPVTPGVQITTPSPPKTPVPGTPEPIFLVVNGPTGEPKLVELPASIAGPTGAPINLKDLIGKAIFNSKCYH